MNIRKINEAIKYLNKCIDRFEFNELEESLKFFEQGYGILFRVDQDNIKRRIMKEYKLKRRCEVIGRK